MRVAFGGFHVSIPNLSIVCLAVSAALHSWANIDRILGRLATGWVVIVCTVEMSTRIVVWWLLASRAMVSGLRSQSQWLRATGLERVSLGNGSIRSYWQRYTIIICTFARSSRREGHVLVIGHGLDVSVSTRRGKTQRGTSRAVGALRVYTGPLPLVASLGRL